MPVHPLVAARFPLIDGIPVPMIDGIPDFDESLNNPEFKKQFLTYTAPYSAYSMPDVQIEDLTIDGPRGPILIRLYRPRTGGNDRPGLLWVHGGAFVTGELDMPEAHVVSAEMAARGAVVASVGYRLATETLRYPAPLDDVDAAWRWFCSAAAGQANLAGLPATRILLSEYDDLRSSGELFVEQLRDVRVPVVSTIAAGMLHGHLNLTPSAAMPEIERSLDFLAEALMPAEALQESQTGQPVSPSAR